MKTLGRIILLFGMAAGANAATDLAQNGVRELRLFRHERDPVTLVQASETAREPSGSRQAGSAGATLLFRNGDLLHGSLHSVEQVVRWERPDAHGLIEVSPSEISEILLPAGKEPDPVRAQCEVHLLNGDEIRGRLATVDAGNVLLDTWYAGRITLPRSRIKWIQPGLPERAIILEGPTGADGWTMGKVKGVPDAGEWLYHGGAFYATQAASIARDVNLPDMASVQLDLAWRGQLHVAIALYTDSLHPINLRNREEEPKFGGFYSLQINRSSANLLPVSQHEPERQLELVPLPMVARAQSARFEIRANRHRNLIALLVDGALVQQWVDAQGFVGEGSGIRLVHQGLGAVRLSNLRITTWDGQFESKPTYDPNGRNDEARLRNGDKLAGSLQSIQDDKMTFDTSGAHLEIPLERVRWVAMAGADAGNVESGPGRIQLHFAQGGQITLNLERWDKNGITGTSPVFGEITLDPSAFDRVEFHTGPSAQTR